MMLTASPPLTDNGSYSHHATAGPPAQPEAPRVAQAQV